MLSRDPDRPQFSEAEVLEILEQLYGLKGTVQELPSERDQNFRVDATSDEYYVLKISATSESVQVLELQNHAMNHLSQHLPVGSSPCPVKSKSGREIEHITASTGSSHAVRLVTYLPGVLLARVTPHTSDFLFSLGQFMGQISTAMESFSDASAERSFYWNLAQAESMIDTYKVHIKSKETVALVEYYSRLFADALSRHSSNLREGILHNDANDYNVLVTAPHSANDRSFGILDFGDMVKSYTVFEVAIAAAYAILDKENPLMAAAAVVAGYHSEFPLNESEIDVLFAAICTRLALSVSISSYQHTLEPENEYLLISQHPAVKALEVLRSVHPRLATGVLRHACGLAPCKDSPEVIAWLERNSTKFGPVLESLKDVSRITHLDLSIGSPLIPSPEHVLDDVLFQTLVSDQLTRSRAEVGVGSYCEPRFIYTTSQYREWDEYRTLHLGIDLFADSNTQVLAPYDGIVHSFRNNALPRDNGPTIILEHNSDGHGPKFYTIYAHLSAQSLQDLEVGKRVTKGQHIAFIGEYPENGGWPSHLHFQIVVDLLDYEGDYPGVASPSFIDVWKSLSPSPNLILSLPEHFAHHTEVSKEELLSIRAAHLGSSLSVSYDQPLKIVRGYMQYLYDDMGRRYLDAVNNVPHVGHGNPTVVDALHKQASVLYTNTRYLHDALAKYVKRLAQTLPEPLSVCYLVNSGSEANELAIRLARAHTGRDGFVALEGAYHGNTDALVGLSSYKHSGPGGSGPPENVQVISNPDPYRSSYGSDSAAAKKHADDVKQAIEACNESGHQIAAFICEPVMSCAGQIVFPPDYLKHVYKHVREAGGVCIADEVQIGFGRMGTHFWGFETQGVIPDIVTMGKPIGNGHPLAAVVTTPEIAESFNTGMEFFSTTGGNTVSCAVGLAVLDEIEKRGLQENAHIVGKYLKSELLKLQEAHPLIGDVRGIGLFLGLELVKNQTTCEPAQEEAHYIVNRMKELGVLISVDGTLHNVLKIKPPLVYTKDNADTLVSALDKVLSEDMSQPGYVHSEKVLTHSRSNALRRESL